MKRFFMILGAALFLANSGAFAEQATLIDFSKLIGEGDAGLHTQTTIDYSIQSGTNWVPEDKAKMKVSLAIPSWEVKLSSSAQSTINQTHSMVKPAPVKAESPKYAGETVMGVRVSLPATALDSWALIQPPFTIPAYATLTGGDQNAKAGTQFDGFGVLKNVGVIRDIEINVLGRNVAETLFIILENEKGKTMEINMGTLNFEGWKSLTWHNNNYQIEVRNRDLQVIPLYPRADPFIKLKGIRIHRSKNVAEYLNAPDTVTYIRDIKVIYDKAVVDRNNDIDDESLWKIYEDREASSRAFELAKLGNLQVLRALETKKMAKEISFDQPATAASATK